MHKHSKAIARVLGLHAMPKTPNDAYLTETIPQENERAAALILWE